MKHILKNQIYHIILYVLLTIVVYYTYPAEEMEHKTALGLNLFQWTLISWLSAGIMQFWVAFFWRLELYGGAISGALGSNGFTLYRIGFVISGLTRMLSIIPVAYLSSHTLQMNSMVRIFTIVLTTPFILWGMYSVLFYFGINRAFGSDHFFEEVRRKPLEKRGTFRYIPNSMYTVVLLVLYHPGLFYESSFGLIFALIQHLFVWTHYFCTERPDLKYMYVYRKDSE